LFNAHGVEYLIVEATRWPEAWQGKLAVDYGPVPTQYLADASSSPTNAPRAVTGTRPTWMRSENSRFLVGRGCRTLTDGD
jgi:hypothetical protein